MDNKKSSKSQEFINLETIGAKLLLGATILALCLTNSPLKAYYTNLFQTPLFQIGGIHVPFNLLFCVNEGLMTIFFLVVGLEIKYEISKGTLNSFRKAALPGIGAIGGMIVPAGIYVYMNYHNSVMLRGWAVPMATDIAFSLAVLSLFGSKIPFPLKTFLTALAILDDVAAIVIIAIFYTNHLDILFLGFSVICILILFTINSIRITQISPYLLIGSILWFCFLKAGIHPTLTGVITAFAIPVTDAQKASPLQKLQGNLHPGVALGILPLFAFANAGVSLTNLGQEKLHAPLIFGTLFGLFIGKQVGIFGASWLAVKLGIAKLSNQVRWPELYIIAILCGIGFTMSLFIGMLAFGYQNADGYLNSLKVGVLSGSLLSGTVGYMLLWMKYRTPKKVTQ